MKNWSRTTCADIWVGNLVEVKGVVDEVTYRSVPKLGRVLLGRKNNGPLDVSDNTEIEVYR